MSPATLVLLQGLVAAYLQVMLPAQVFYVMEALERSAFFWGASNAAFAVGFTAASVACARARDARAVLDVLHAAHVAATALYALAPACPALFVAARLLQGALLLHFPLCSSCLLPPGARSSADVAGRSATTLAVASANVSGGTAGAVGGALLLRLQHRFVATNAAMVALSASAAATYWFGARGGLGSGRDAADDGVATTGDAPSTARLAYLVAAFCAGAGGMSMDTNSILVGATIAGIASDDVWKLTLPASMAVLGASAGVQALAHHAASLRTVVAALVPLAAALAGCATLTAYPMPVFVAVVSCAVFVAVACINVSMASLACHRSSATEMLVWYNFALQIGRGLSHLGVGWCVDAYAAAGASTSFVAQTQTVLLGWSLTLYALGAHPAPARTLV